MDSLEHRCELGSCENLLDSCDELVQGRCMRAGHNLAKIDRLARRRVLAETGVVIQRRFNRLANAVDAG